MLYNITAVYFSQMSKNVSSENPSSETQRGMSRRRFLDLTLKSLALTPLLRPSLTGLTRMATESSPKKTDVVKSNELQPLPPKTIQVGTEVVSFAKENIPTLEEFQEFQKIYADWFVDLPVTPEVVYANFQFWCSISFQILEQLQRVQAKHFEGENQPSMALLTSAALLANEIKSCAAQKDKTQNTDAYMHDAPLRELFRNTVLNYAHTKNSDRVADFLADPPKIDFPPESYTAFLFQNPELPEKVHTIVDNFTALKEIPQQYWTTVEQIDIDKMVEQFQKKFDIDAFLKKYIPNSGENIPFDSTKTEILGRVKLLCTYLKELKPTNFADFHSHAKKYAMQIMVLASFLDYGPEVQLPPELQEWVGELIIGMSSADSLLINAPLHSFAVGQPNREHQELLTNNFLLPMPSNPDLGEVILNNLLLLLNNTAADYDEGSLHFVPPEVVQAALLPALNQCAADLFEIREGRGAESISADLHIPLKSETLTEEKPNGRKVNGFPPSHEIEMGDNNTWVEVLLHELLHSFVDLDTSHRSAVLGFASTIDATILFGMKIYFILSLLGEVAKFEGALNFDDILRQTMPFPSQVGNVDPFLFYNFLIQRRDKTKDLATEGFTLPEQIDPGDVQQIDYAIKSGFWTIFHILQGIFSQNVQMVTTADPKNQADEQVTFVSAFVGDKDPKLKKDPQTPQQETVSRMVKTLYMFTVRMLQTGLPTDVNVLQGYQKLLSTPPLLSSLPQFERAAQPLDLLSPEIQSNNSEMSLLTMAMRISFLFNKPLLELAQKEAGELAQQSLSVETTDDETIKTKPGLWHQRYNLRKNIAFVLGHEFIALAKMDSTSRNGLLKVLFNNLAVPAGDAQVMVLSGIEKIQSTLHDFAKQGRFLSSMYEGDANAYTQQIDVFLNSLKNEVKLV